MSNKQQAGGAMRRFPRKIARTDGQLDDLERQLIDATKVPEEVWTPPKGK